jgi:arginine-tRNA-protein transferase
MSQDPSLFVLESWPLIHESRFRSTVSPEEMDSLWAAGWRHFGPNFFRSSLMVDETDLKRQIALRIDLRRFALSKSQRRTIRRNEDLEWSLEPAAPGEGERELFQIHKKRFVQNVPDRLEDFLGERPDGQPCRCLQLSVREGDRLVAASFLALGRQACSSIYAVFDPCQSRRRLGIYTMLVELQHAMEAGYDFYYSGYATVEPSCYDYKRHFAGLEFYDWQGRWRPLEKGRA